MVLKKNLLSNIYILIIASLISCQPTNSPEKNAVSDIDTLVNEPGRLLPKKLRYIPFGIIVQHDPNPCYPELENGQYVWKHNTTVRANKDMQIIEYGSFVYTKKGWYHRVTNDTKFFDEHYGTKNGQLKKDSVYIDPLSFRYGETAYAGDAMWYYIAVDASGNKYKGIGPIETEGISIEQLNNLKGIKSFSKTKSAFNWIGYGEIGNYSLSGTLKLNNGTYTIQNDSLISTNIVFDMSSIESKQEGLADHLKNADFFDASLYPTAQFVLNNRVVIQNTMIIKGNLTIKGITRELSIPIKHKLFNDCRIFEGTASFNRTLFNIKYNSKDFFSNLGDQAIKNNIDIYFKIVALN